MARSPRSRKQTLILCMEHWEWLRDNPGKYKDEWPRAGEWKQFEKYSYCFCCMSVKYNCSKCYLLNYAWYENSITPCYTDKSLFMGFQADKIVWACYVALNEKWPEEFPL